MKWIGQHWQEIQAIAVVISAVSAAGSWACTVWSDRRTQIRFDQAQSDREDR